MNCLLYSNMPSHKSPTQLGWKHEQTKALLGYKS
uniref:Uncharacterized protein n=1 Tax=Rhizophora mucronata TaxID=61149 RepID=A0A2P2NX84_RHIMU